MNKFTQEISRQLSKCYACIKCDNRPFAAKPSQDLFFMKLWAIT